MTRIFVSYSRQDEAFARRIALDLEHLGADVWLDIKDISAGEKWSTAIQKALQQADVMLVIISPASIASTNVEDEWQYFVDQKKPIIPIRWKPADIHFQLSRVQYIDFYQREYAVAFEQLLDVLRSKDLSVFSAQIAASQPIIKRRSLLNEPWAIILAAIITGAFALGAALISRQPASIAATFTVPATTAVALIPTNTVTEITLTATITATQSPTIHTEVPTFTLLPPTATPSPTVTNTPIPSATEVPSRTPILPTHTMISSPTFASTLAMVSIPAASTPTPTLTASPVLSGTSEYLCRATVIADSGEGSILNIVRPEPVFATMPNNSVTVGQEVFVLKRELEGSRTIWYEIADLKQNHIGFILEDFLDLSPSCPSQ
jgi:hypothetical protein